MKKLMLMLGLLVSTVGYGWFELDNDGLPRGSYNGTRGSQNGAESTCALCSYDDDTGWLECRHCIDNSGNPSYHPSINLKVLEQLFPALRGHRYDIINDDGKLKLRLSNGGEYQFTREKGLKN